MFTKGKKRAGVMSFCVRFYNKKNIVRFMHRILRAGPPQGKKFRSRKTKQTISSNRFYNISGCQFIPSSNVFYLIIQEGKKQEKGYRRQKKIICAIPLKVSFSEYSAENLL
ncbi:MAG TPA: hypothetical protein DCL73_15720 [Treponema sp.]|nr:hypothetical protein [Treponema sp.]